MCLQLSEVSQSDFGYSAYPDKEVGFYVVCNDKMILKNINDLMRKRGIVGITDTAGRMHYMLDSRAGVPSIVRKITGQAVNDLDHSTLSNADLLTCVDEVLKKYNFDYALLGTRITRCILVHSIRNPSIMSAVTKQVYPLAGREFGITASKVERNIRYVFRKMELFKEGRRNVYILQTLHSEVVDRIVKKHDCLPYPARLSV